ncbi:MAG: magnesium transporter, partial [Chthoniobacterales bacterium]|nr:magnesium transporter [Chthoniobacterales bacterium]
MDADSQQVLEDVSARAQIKALLPAVVDKAPKEAAKMLLDYPDNFIVEMLQLMNPNQAQRVLECLPNDRRQKVLAAAELPTRQQWARNEAYKENTVGQMMEPPLATFPPTTLVAQVVEELRLLVGRALITYVFVIDEEDRLLGVVAMRELLLASPEQRIEEVMIRNPFYLTPNTELVEAMRETMLRHYPVYPVCEEDGRLVGLVRGQMLFEARTVELSLQAGSMVGVEKEERLGTKWTRSFSYRHPWLQANLVLSFIAAGVVGAFQDTVDRLVVLAVFLPVIISQSSNSGVQALAVVLRSMTLGELRAGKEYPLVMKETLLGLVNGALTGVSAAVAMYIFARIQGGGDAGWLALVVFLAMTLSCLLSGTVGALVPLVLRKLGTDPAAASSII